jgi:hypothetical protein
MKKEKVTVLFVHGFGVGKGARGMFSELAKRLSSEFVKCVLFDLNTTDGRGNILVNPFSEQIRILGEVHKKHAGVNTKVVLIAHSQGCLVAAMADLPNIATSIFLAPSVASSSVSMITHFSKSPRTKILLNGMSKIARSDGTITMVPADFWMERQIDDVRKLYGEYQKGRNALVVIAKNDAVVNNKNIDRIFSHYGKSLLLADHDFTDPARKDLLRIYAGQVG